jgi:signal transduction histidine kinase
VRERGVRALHGVPLLDGGALLGVAYVGSLTVEQLGDWDRRLFEAMAARASAGIALHLAREEAEGRARALRDKEVELRAAVHDRERANARLEGLLQSAPIGVGFWDRELRYQRVNDRLAEIDGLPPEAHLGKTPSELLPGLEGVEELERRWREAIATGRDDEPRELAGETPAAPGVRRFFLEQSYLVRDGEEVVGLGAVVIERTEERRSQEALALLARTSEVLAAVADPDVVAQRIARLLVPEFADWAGVVLRDGKAPRRFSAAPDPAYDDVARAAVAALCVDVKRARAGLGRVLREGQPEIVPAVDEPFLREVAPGASDRAALDAIGLCSWVAVPLRARDEVVGAVALARGHSGRRFDGRDLALALEVARRCAVAIDNARLLVETRREAELRQRVLAIVSHDLRNPLSAILMAAGRVVSGAPEGAAGERLHRAGDTIQRAAERMNRLIADLLDAASVQAGRLSVAPTPQSPAAMLREVAEAFGPAAREKGLSLEVEVEADVPDVLADHDRIVQVLSNLVSNAVKVTARGGVTVGARVVGAEAAFTVRDTGPGVPAELVPRLFEPYARGADASYKGTGLGLWISKGIVDAHGGEIGFETTQGEGTAFQFTLPLA